MKFRCTDCGCEYENKPDYCDCGNNTFDEIIQKQTEKPTPQLESTQPKREKIRIKKDFDYIGWGVFLTCIILAILSIMFLGNGILKKAAEESKSQKPILQPKQNIPSIESIWKTSTTTQIMPQTTKTTTKPVVKTQAKQVKKVTTTKPVQKQPKQTTQTQPIKTTPKIDVQKYIPQTQTQPQPVVKPVEQKPVVDLVAQQQELLQYKIALRNRIASKIDFTQVIGDGNCKVTFKINSSGTLTDRKFAQQSSNVSLNDVVYNAMMQNPAYKSPPEGYKNETLTLSVKIYGGNFEIDLR